MTSNSFYTKYYGSFYDNVTHKDRIDIYIKQADIPEMTIPEKLLLDGNPLTIAYPTKDFAEQLFGCGAKINIINDSSDFFRYDDLFSVPERNTYVEIIKTINYNGVGGLETLVYGHGPPGIAVPQGDSSIFLFQGYVLPEMYTSTLEQNIRVTIPCTDQLSILDRYTPIIMVDTSTYRSDEYLNAFDILSTILLDTDITGKIDIHSDMMNVNYVKDASSPSTVFNNIFFNAANFADRNNLLNDKMVMEMILKPFVSRCYYSNGKWIIERVPDMGKLTKDFVSYTYDVSGLAYNNVNNTRVNLSNYDIIAKSGNLTFQPGNIKIVTALNYKLAPSLTENYYYDAQYYAHDISTKSLKPLPANRKWMASDTDASLYFENFTDQNIDAGIAFGPSGDWGLNLDKYTYLGNQYMSTMFQFTPAYETIVGVNITHSIIPNITNAGQNVKASFALRALDSSGNDWWIARSTENDTSTYWRNSLYLFETIKLYEDIQAANFKFEISENVDISRPVNTGMAILEGKRLVKDKTTLGDIVFFWRDNDAYWETYTYSVPTTLQKIGELYLDVYSISRTSSSFPPTTWFPYWTQFGDVDVDVDVEIPNTVLESILDTEANYFTSIQNFELDIFDTEAVQFTNGVYNMDSSGNYRTVWGWRDNIVDNYVPLADKFMENLANMYWKPRYGLTVDVRSKDSSLFTLGNIYTHDSFIYPDGSTMEFICNGLEYNVKENAYRLSLLEYDQDSNWKVDPIIPYFNVTPANLTFNYLGSPAQTITVDTNVASWTYTESSTWIVEVSDTSTSVTVGAQALMGADRNGYVLFFPDGMNFYSVGVHQDSSGADPYILFNESGAIDFSYLNGAAVDISVWISAGASVYSNFGYSRSTDCTTELFVDSGSVNSVYATVTTTTQDFQETTSWSNLIDTKDTSIVDVAISLGQWQGDQEADCYAQGAMQIVSCKLHGTNTDVSILYNRFDSYHGAGGTIVSERSYNIYTPS